MVARAQAAASNVAWAKIRKPDPIFGGLGAHFCGQVRWKWDPFWYGFWGSSFGPQNGSLVLNVIHFLEMGVQFWDRKWLLFWTPEFQCKAVKNGVRYQPRERGKVAPAHH